MLDQYDPSVTSLPQDDRQTQSASRRMTSGHMRRLSGNSIQAVIGGQTRCLPCFPNSVNSVPDPLLLGNSIQAGQSVTQYGILPVRSGGDDRDFSPYLIFQVFQIVPCFNGKLIEFAQPLGA